MMKKTKLKKQKIAIGDRQVSILPIESEFELSETVRYNYDDQDVGALLLRKGEGNFKVIFGFETQGINNVLPQSEVDKVFDPIEQGLKDFPDNESLTIHQTLFVDHRQRQAELEELIATAPTPELQFLLMSELKNTQILSQKGIRKKATITLYATYTFTSEGKKSKDFIEQGLQIFEKNWRNITGTTEQAENLRIEELLKEAYTEGYEHWYNLISSKLGLEVKTLSREALWERVTERFTDKKLEIPQTIHMSEERGIEIEINSHLSPISKIFATAKTPVADDRWIYAKDNYIGVLALGEKADGWKDKRTQLKFIWNILSKQEIYDTEIILQIVKGNVRTIRENMQSVTKQAMTDGEIAANQNNVDVAAKLKTERALKAQEALYNDEIPFKTAVVFLVHRPNKKELDRACNFLAAQFQSPLELLREEIYAYRIWLQTIPIHWERLLLKPYDRQWIYSNTEVQGIMPLVQASSTNNKGIEFLSIEGGVPIYLDLWSQLKHAIILATNRGGKGILLAKIIAHHLSRGVPVSVMDFPRPDGTSTFSFMAEFFEGLATYLNTSEESFNIFEIPNLSKLTVKEQKVRFKDFKEALIDILQTMVVGLQATVGVNPDSIKSILTIAVEQFYDTENLEIHNRFTSAFKAGMGTEEWEQTPVLEDFIAMLGPERLKLPDPTPELRQAINHTKLRLNYWKKSRIGQAISRPSTINADAKLAVYAMTNLNSEEDASVLTLAISMHCMRKSMEHRESVILVDEVSILVDFEAIAKMIGRFCANGLKSGIQMLLSGQDIDSIAKSPYADKILQNIPVKLIGRLEKRAIDSLVKQLKYEAEIIDQNASQKFHLVKKHLASSWTITIDEKTSVCRYYTDPVLLAMVANNPSETELRKKITLEHSNSNKYVGLKAFADTLAAKIQEG